ncbi:FUSC family protein [Paenibacillus sonchi]|uniref:FUSC family protein n=1 Tax=Paenibacillus sonchi TaxID=373687 RepID=A0A974SDD7_9BACL|nr:FUSC family protein [Paenibacillus sonchi]MCE3203845.1 FUSC family protein [Paenibacillus sonchi]QQZ62353.1 FUSC family protein [Paenibacillus sonchi]
MNEGLQDRLEKFGLSLYMIRVTLAASLSWLAVHTLYGDSYLYFAPLAAILITQGSVKASLEKGVYRMTGIVLGGIVSLVVGRFFDVGALSILLMLLIGIGVATACRINIQAISQVGVTSVLALTFYNDHYIEWRVAETLIGVVIALIINMIIVPPKGFVKVKGLALEGGLLLADALSGQTGGGREAIQAGDALTRSASLLAKSELQQKELHYTLTHYHCRNELRGLTQTTAHLKKIHSYVKEIRAEIALLPAHYAAADWMAEVVTATADCIALYGTKTLSDAECQRSLPESLRRARDLQLAWFSELQGQCSLTSIRDLGAVFSHLNRVLEEIEQADYVVMSAAPQKAKAGAAHAVRFIQKGLSHKL